MNFVIFKLNAKFVILKFKFLEIIGLNILIIIFYIKYIEILILRNY